MSLEKLEKDLLKTLLNYAKSLMANKGCTDIPEEWLKNWTDEDKNTFTQNTREGNKEDHHPLGYTWWAFTLLCKKYFPEED